MSFKRDGDDVNLLRNLNHHRVRELLSSHIPQDEAKLLSNGRLSCCICLHRPVFDTMNMLAIHRRGKRHLFELSKYIKCKEDAVLKELQRKHTYCDNSAEENNFLAKPTQCQKSSSLPQNHILGLKHAEVKNTVFGNRRKPTLEIQPGVPAKLQAVQNPTQAIKKSACATVRHYLKNMSRKSSLEKVVEKNRENYGIDLLKSRSEVSTSKNTEIQVKHSETKSKIVPQSISKQHDYETNLRMSGWIKDCYGNWMKDPNAEFDSDEDEAPPPPCAV